MHLSFHVHPCLNRVHRISVYFVSQKITAPALGAHFAGARGNMPPASYPPLLGLSKDPQSAHQCTVYILRRQVQVQWFIYAFSGLLAIYG